MKLELIIFGITGFLLYNSYHDGKYSKIILSYKKYYKMIIIAFVAICLYLMIKRNPLHAKNMLLYTNNFIKYMPIDRSSMDMITPIFDLSSKNNFMEGFNSELNPGYNYNPVFKNNTINNAINNNAINNAKNNYNNKQKRSVSETKKKYVASMQDWKCGECNKKLIHTFEVDHKIRLEYGGGNDVSNLVALCRECHGKKTAMENM
jgi:hypothetical protein